jgi:hypothetical protein
MMTLRGLSVDYKFVVKVYEATKPKRIPKEVSGQLKGVAGPKAISRMKKESVDCPVVKEEVGFLVCFLCPSFLRRVTGEVHCAGGEGPPKEWLL